MASDGLTAVVAALPEEVAPLRRAMKVGRVVRAGKGRFFRGFLDGRDVVIGWTGDGKVSASSGLRRVLAEGTVDRVLLIGLAGGLTPDLQSGRVVVASEARSVDGEQYAPDRSWLTEAIRRGLVAVTMVTGDRILATREAKKQLRDELGLEGPATVDLETVVWAGVVAGTGTPWLAVRVVSDGVNEDLPLDFERCRGIDGRIRRNRVVLHALARPARLPGLMRLATRTRACASRLERAVRDILRAN